MRVGGYFWFFIICVIFQRYYDKSIEQEYVVLMKKIEDFSEEFGLNLEIRKDIQKVFKQNNVVKGESRIMLLIVKMEFLY